MSRSSNETAVMSSIANEKFSVLFYPSVLLLLACAVFCCAPIRAQLPTQQVASISSSSDTAVTSLPDAPQAQSDTASGTTPVNQAIGPKKHTFGIVPNYGMVTVDMHLPPQSPKEKLLTATQDAFNVYSLALRGTVASIDLARNSTPEFGTGGVGYSRYLWHTFVDNTIETSFVEFIIPSVTHEDIRYYTLGRGGFFKRSAYAIGRVFVIRSDSGKRTFNFSEIVGAGAAAGISNLYYPTPERTLSNTLGQWGLNVGIDGLTFVAREFLPDVSHHFSHRAKPAPANSVNP